MDNWLKNTPIAHRGLHNKKEGIPENSLLSFKEAMKHGYAIELDLRLTADKRVVVFHDVYLDRVTDSNKRLDETNYEELRSLQLEGSDQLIPTLEEVLDLVQGEVPLLIEIKSYIFTGEIEKSTHTALLNYTGAFAIQCFNPWTIKWFKDNAPTIKRGLLAGRMKDIELNIFKKMALRTLVFSPIVQADFISLEYDGYTPQMAKRLATLYKVKDVLFWTIDDKERAHHLRSRFGLNYIFESFLPLG